MAILLALYVRIEDDRAAYQIVPCCPFRINSYLCAGKHSIELTRRTKKNANNLNSKIMKVKYLLLSLMGAMALSASAQTTAPENQLPARKTAFDRSGGHWFITLQGGVSAQFIAGNEAQDIVKRLHVMPTLSIGKWHNPYFATRLQLMAGPTPTYYKNAANDIVTNNTAMAGAFFDFMFDVVNYYSKYNAKRVFHFIPFAGVGYNFKYYNDFKDFSSFFSMSEPYRHSVAANVGAQMAFRLGKRVDFVLEAQAIYNNLNIVKKDFDYADASATYMPAGVKAAYNGLLGVVTAGLNFNLGKVEWETITPMDMDLINDLNGQINSLRAENAELAKRPVSCPECPEVVAPETKVVAGLSEKAITFKFDSDKLTPNQEIVLYEIAKFVKESNQPITVIGFADVTGNANYNLALSERRAKAVANILTTKYDVPSDMINVEWQGETEQFDTRAWNRVVIVRSK